MDYYAGIDVSLEYSSVCVVDGSGKIVCEAKVASEPEALIVYFASSGLALSRIGLEAGPLSQWLYAAMRDAGLAVELLEPGLSAAKPRSGAKIRNVVPGFRCAQSRLRPPRPIVMHPALHCRSDLTKVGSAAGFLRTGLLHDSGAN
jgi:hypothetical protein